MVVKYNSGGNTPAITIIPISIDDGTFAGEDGAIFERDWDERAREEVKVAGHSDGSH